MATTIGIIRLWWRGKKYDVQKGVRFKPPGLQNANVMVAGRALRSQSYNVGTAQATIQITSDMAIADFDPSLGEGELQLQADTGQTWTIPDAYVMTFPEVQDSGAASVNWSFNTYQEIS
ncbi:phage tail tube protein [Neokomagataea anthophila]|uniref:Phage tail tube protein n=1 Tax=Neokomagataea anthophila TaxID=2826925 RepID=A0ABS5E6G2_9PROT|nr:phage tail tube protein [Neokomagataea anthophila]MBR0559497.1 phage tail tube protein [Neokomagataea anthophila]